MVDARLDAEVVFVLANGIAEARLDAVAAFVLAPVPIVPETAPFTITAFEQYPSTEMAPFTMSAEAYVGGSGVGVAGMPWIQTTQPSIGGVLWLADGIPLNTVVGGGWGMVVAIRP